MVVVVGGNVVAGARWSVVVGAVTGDACGVTVVCVEPGNPDGRDDGFVPGEDVVTVGRDVDVMPAGAVESVVPGAVVTGGNEPAGSADGVLLLAAKVRYETTHNDTLTTMRYSARAGPIEGNRTGMRTNYGAPTATATQPVVSTRSGGR